MRSECKLRSPIEQMINWMEIIELKQGLLSVLIGTKMVREGSESEHAYFLYNPPR